MIPYQDFARLLTDATEFPTLSAYIAECGGSVPLDDAQQVCTLLERIWTMGHGGLTMQSILNVADESLMALAHAYKLPYRTMQDWRLGNRRPPDWQLPFIAYAVLSDMD